MLNQQEDFPGHKEQWRRKGKERALRAKSTSVTEKTKL